MKKAILIPLFIMAIAMSVKGQSLAPTVLSSAGGYFDNGSVSLSWTLGEVAVTTISSGNYVLTQGFQQSKLTITGVRELDLNWSLEAYPNPVQDQLRVKFSIDRTNDFEIEVMDMTGKSMRIYRFDGLVNGTELEIDFTGFTQGIYLLNIRTTDRSISKTVRIQKY